MADWFNRAFGTAVGDIRDHLILDAWFGEAARPTPSSDFDRVLQEKLYPDKTDRGFLGWLQEEHGQDKAHQPGSPEPDHCIDR